MRLVGVCQVMGRRPGGATDVQGALAWARGFSARGRYGQVPCYLRVATTRPPSLIVCSALRNDINAARGLVACRSPFVLSPSWSCCWIGNVTWVGKWLGPLPRSILLLSYASTG